MAQLNKVILTGTLTRDMEKRSDKFANLSLVQDVYNGTETVPQYFNVTLLGANNISRGEKILKKGANITIDGFMEPNEYEKDAVKVRTIQIKTFNFYMNKFAKDQAQASAAKQVSYSKQDDAEPLSFSDLEF